MVLKQADLSIASLPSPPPCACVANPPTQAESSRGFWDSTAHRNAAPWADGTYIIVEKKSGRAICRPENGRKLRLADSADVAEGYHWMCVRTDGLLGFCERKSGKFMGHRNTEELVATASHHRGWERFAVSPHPDGGFVLLSQHWLSMWELAIAEDNESIVIRPHGGAIWEFVQVR